MRLKQIVKNALGAVRCRLAGVTAGKGTYVGSRVHFVNGKNVTMADDVQVRPGCDLFAGGGGIVVGARSDIGERNRIDGDVVIGESVLFGPDNYISSRPLLRGRVPPCRGPGVLQPKKERTFGAAHRRRLLDRVPLRRCGRRAHW